MIITSNLSSPAATWTRAATFLRRARTSCCDRFWIYPLLSCYDPWLLPLRRNRKQIWRKVYKIVLAFDQIWVGISLHRSNCWGRRFPSGRVQKFALARGPLAELSNLVVLSSDWVRDPLIMIDSLPGAKGCSVIGYAILALMVKSANNTNKSTRNIQKNIENWDVVPWQGSDSLPRATLTF